MIGSRQYYALAVRERVFGERDIRQNRCGVALHCDSGARGAARLWCCDNNNDNLGSVRRQDMRNGQNNNNKRMRNRNNNNNNNSNNNRRGQNPMTRVFESNGPDIKIRGTASHVAEKYVQLARDARSSGDPVAAENYYQHAEHYFRLIAAAQEQFRQNQPQPRTDNEMAPEDGDDEGESFSHFGQEPGFVPVQQQPFVPRDNTQREFPRAD